MQIKNRLYYGEIKWQDWYFYVAATNIGLCYVSSQPYEKNGFKNWISKQFPNALVEKNLDQIEPYTTQLIEYVCGKRKVFDMPLDLQGTSFQKSVWKTLQEIPFG